MNNGKVSAHDELVKENKKDELDQGDEEDIEEEDEEEEDEEDEEDEAVVDFHIDIDPNQNIKDVVVDSAADEDSKNVAEQMEIKETSENNYSHIKNDDVRFLMGLNLDSKSKEEVINILLNLKTFDKKIEEPKKEKGKKKFNVESQYNLLKLTTKNENKTNNFNATNADFNTNNNPECTNDFSTAVKKLLSKMRKDPSSNPELLKILFSDKNKINSGIESLKFVTPDHIDHKVRNYLLNKEKKLNGIVEKLNEEFMLTHTFTPDLIISNDSKQNQSINKRNLDQFLKDQNMHNRRIQEKVKLQIEENKRKEEDLIIGQPKIDENSQKIFNSKFKSDEPTHLRLYNRRFDNKKKEALDTTFDENKNKDTKNKIENFLNKMEKEKNPPPRKDADDYLKNKLFHDASIKNEKIVKLKRKIHQEESKKSNFYMDNGSNKFMLHSIMDKYKIIINGITFETNDKCDEQINNHTSNSNNNAFSHLNLLQVNNIFNKIGFTVYVDSNTEEDVHNQSILKRTEKKLINDAYESLKNSNDLVNIDDLFIFILAVINLYEYYIYYNYRKTTQNKKTKSDSDSLEYKQEIITKINLEINNKISTHTKYGAFDENNNFFITIDKSKLILQDFKIFYVNFMNSKVKTQPELNAKYNSFKPQINENSNKLSEEFRRKILSELNNPEENVNKNNNHLNYIDKLILKKKKKEW